MKKLIILLFASFLILALLQIPTKDVQAAKAKSGDLIKTADSSTVYYLGTDNKRYVFPNNKAFNTWYANFSHVFTVSKSELSSYPLSGKNITYRPGTKLLKITTDPRVYAVASNNTLRWIASEAIAQDLYGPNWPSFIDDLPDQFFGNYQIGEPITSIAGYNKDQEKISISRPVSIAENLPKFASCAALKEVLDKNQRVWGYETLESKAVAAPTAKAESDTATTPEFSGTNVQVQGIDEADIVKTDGNYIYTINTSDKKLNIIKAYPVDTARLVAQVNLNIDPEEMFIHDNRLMVFGTKYQPITLNDQVYAFSKISIYPRSKTFMIADIYNITDRANPILERSIEFEGSYKTARKINDQVYFVVNSYPSYSILEQSAEGVIPLFRDRSQVEIAAAEAVNYYPITSCINIDYLPNIEPEQFVTVASVSMSSAESPVNQKVILGSADNVYASFNNIYLVDQKYNWLSWSYDDSNEESIVNVFGINNGDVWFKNNLEVPGRILNQFSMDEYNNYFRIATTVGHVSRSEESTADNNLYIFNSEQSRVGSLENLAPGEQIYSVRFMGDRAYMVTFKKVDPLFVIDTSEPTNPKVLGQLKIPGFSDYLHPYDENHIIGVGKETVEAKEGDFAWYQGMKLALFDVTDVNNPKELHKTVIGDRGTDSYALSDHKAFLFDKNKNLLALPIRLAELSEGEKETADWSYGDYIYQGSYVYNLTLTDGFKLKGRVTHYDSGYPSAKIYYDYSYDNDILRNLYISDNLYSVSQNKLKINSLDTIAELKAIDLD